MVNLPHFHPFPPMFPGPKLEVAELWRQNATHSWYMRLSTTWQAPKLMVYDEISYPKGWFGGIPSLGNLHSRNQETIKTGFSSGTLRFMISGKMSSSSFCVWRIDNFSVIHGGFRPWDFPSPKMLISLLNWQEISSRSMPLLTILLLLDSFSFFSSCRLILDHTPALASFSSLSEGVLWRAPPAQGWQ